MRIGRDEIAEELVELMRQFGGEAAGASRWRRAARNCGFRIRDSGFRTHLRRGAQFQFPGSRLKIQRVALRLAVQGRCVFLLDYSPFIRLKSLSIVALCGRALTPDVGEFGTRSLPDGPR